MVALLHKYPAAVAWVSGHSHVNSVEAYKDPAGDSGFWSIRTAALADWPKQNRLVEIFDNKDGNLSIFGTLIDQASPVPAPADWHPRRRDDSGPARFRSDETIGYNDNQNGGAHCGAEVCGEGTVIDRNVELLIKDPRREEINPAERSSPRSAR